MDGELIERSNFRKVRRGYDPAEVDAHLRQVGAEVSRMRAAYEGSQTISGAAAGRVQAILEAAERSATEIEEARSADARGIIEDAEARARELLEQAEAEAAVHLERVEEAAVRILERASAAEDELTRLVDGLHDNGGALVEEVRTGAESIRADLAAIQGRVAEVSAGPEGSAGSEVDALERDVATEAGPSLHPDERGDEDAAVVETAEEPPEEAQEAGASASTTSTDGARLIALNMALNGTPRKETAAYLADNFGLRDSDDLLDDVYSRTAGRG